MTNDISQAIIPRVHPAFKKTFTIGDCYDIAAITGLNAQDITGIVTGRSRPNEIIASRLRPVFGEDIVDSLMKNYDPYRFFEYLGNEKIKREYRVKKNVEVRDIPNGSCLLTHDDQWLRISQVERNENFSTLYSGGTYVGRFRNDNYFVVAIPNTEYKGAGHTKYERRAERAQVREILQRTGDRGETLEQRKQLLESMISDIQKQEDTRGTN